MKVYGHYISVTTLQVLTLMFAKRYEPAIAELLTIVDVFTQEQKQPAHLARHPFGHIPVLDDEGFRLYETHAILRYLDGRLPGHSYVPTELHDRAHMDQWLCIEQNYLMPAAKKIMARNYAKMMTQPDPGAGVVEEGKRELAVVIGQFADWIAGRLYVAGNAISLADVCWWADLRHMNVARPLDDPRIKAWWTRIDERDEYKRAVAVLAAQGPTKDGDAA